MTLHDIAVVPVAIAIVGVAITAVGGAKLTRRGAWYQQLRKPTWEPPDWLFGPAWSAIFILWAVSFVLAWEATASDGERLRLSGVFAANAGLNVLWSYLFFHRRQPRSALLETIPFLASIVLMILVAGALDPRAGWLLVPYLLWVAFATILNAKIVSMNDVSRPMIAEA